MPNNVRRVTLVFGAIDLHLELATPAKLNRVSGILPNASATVLKWLAKVTVPNVRAGGMIVLE